MSSREGKEPDIRKRAYEFSLRIIKLCKALSQDKVGSVLFNQLLRTGTAIGANVEEAQEQSQEDFVAKMSVARKEALETNYWLRLLKDSETLPTARLDEIIDESEQIGKMLASIVKTAKEKL